jgi:hypothetical protein
MIEIPRALARRFLAVLRRSVMAGNQRGFWPVVLCRTDKAGIVLQARQGEVALRCRLEGSSPLEEEIAFRASLLSEIEGRDDSPVSLETVSPGKGRARWTDGDVPRVLDFDTVAPETLPALPPPPRQMRPLPPEFLNALAEATATAARESVRLALARIQLRGHAGEVVATDGRQLLIQGGFTFPWADDVLIPALPVFGHRALSVESPLALGRTRTDLVLRAGPWTLLLALDTAGRFPKADQVVPKPEAVTSRLRLDPEDATVLAAALPKLPGHDEQHAPVTLDLSQPPVVRARGQENGPVTEVVLTRSSSSGPPVRLCMARHHLRRALQLGFADIQIVSEDKPVCCCDSTRTYVWVPLDAKGVILPSAEALRIAGPEQSAQAESTAPERRTDPMPPIRANGDTPPDNGAAADQQAQPSIVEVISEAEALRDLLHNAFARTSRLLAALKHQRRQAKAVQQAMQSLRQLQLDR